MCLRFVHTCALQPLHYPQLLIALPLSPSFNPPPTSFSHDHLFDGDKVSLPSHYWSVIRSLDIPVPWVIKISRQHNHDQYDQNSRVVTKSASTRTPQTYLPFKTTQLLTSPLDFRAPSNYIFLPMWMFRSLGLRPGEIVLAGLAKQVDDGGKVTLRPLTFKESEAEGSEYNSPIEVGLGSDFLKIASPTAVLETSLKHYSTLTAATVISLVYNDKRYYFEVVETRDKRGRVVEAVKVQDCDVQVEFIKGKVVK